MPRTGARGGPQTRATIGEVAARLFLERGFDEVTVADVAKQAGVSSVTVFKHFPRKEDLFLDRSVDALELVRSAVRDRGPGVDVLTSLHEMTLRLVDSRHPLSGADDRSVPFFRTVATSPALIARAREIAAELQQTLTEELERDPAFRGDPTLLAAFFVAGYSAVMVQTARRLVHEQDARVVLDDHRARFAELFHALRSGVSPDPGQRSDATDTTQPRAAVRSDNRIRPADMEGV